MSRIAPLFALLCSAVVLGGCAESRDESSSSDGALHGATAGDADLERLIAQMPADITMANAHDLLHTAIAPGLTTKRLKMINELAGAGMKRYPANPDGSVDPKQAPYAALTANIQVAYGSVPRDMKAAPAGFAGQSLRADIRMDDDSATIGSIKVVGTASADYELELTLGDHEVHAHVRSGATPEQTAKIVADAVTADKDAIMRHMFDEIGIGDNKGEFGGSDGYEARADGDTVTFDEEING